MSTITKPTLVVSDENKNTSKPSDTFDFESMRLPPDFEREAGVRKQLTTVRVRKPRRQEWIRVHPDEDYRIRVATIEYKENDESSTEIYLLTAEVAEYLNETSPEEITYATLYLACNRQGDIFIWPCRDPRADSKMGRDVAATTRIEAAEAAMERQVRVQWR
jgi:hypothetical protein